MNKNLIYNTNYLIAFRRSTNSIVLVLIILLILISLPSHRPIEWKRYSISGKAQGTTYSIIYYGKDSLITKEMIDLSLIKIDSSLSLYKSYSNINQFNNSATGIILDKYMLPIIKK